MAGWREVSDLRKQGSGISSRRDAIWKCNAKHPKQQFSAKVGTIFEDSPIGLDKWFAAAWMVANCKNGVSSYEIHRALGVTQKTAWFMDHRIRLAMQTGTFEKVAGQFEVDESFIGGLARNMHKDRKAKITGTGGAGKAVVMGLLDRETRKVRLRHVANTAARDASRRDPRTRRRRFIRFQRCMGRLQRTGSRVRSPGDRSRRKLREGQRSHERNREFLEAAKARPERNLRQRRTVPSVPLSGRTGVPFNNRKTNDGARFMECCRATGKRVTYGN